jgi:hypothetical protein
MTTTAARGSIGIALSMLLAACSSTTPKPAAEAAHRVATPTAASPARRKSPYAPAQ